ncbi:MAG: FdtA/QdtA family cupin domain-containing protein [Proteobacteria bacterium]|nr:FdtA/QdtA family cupin domain-containing protein [Pseudomonadota bacterium]
MILNRPSLINFGSMGSSELGYISVAEGNKLFPFQIKRVYWTYFTPQNVIRGRHAHRRLEQIIFAISGVIDCETEMIDGQIVRFRLDEPNMGLFLPINCWHEMKFSHAAVLMCLASMEYDETDYIRDYSEFKKVRENEN